jgi:hypothetical protein
VRRRHWLDVASSPNTAADDDLIRRSPCRINAGSESARERPTGNVARIFDLDDRVSELSRHVTGVRRSHRS